MELRDRAFQRWTPLLYAVDWERLDTVRYLIASGANVNARTSHGYSILLRAAGSQTPLQSAVNVGGIGPARVLLENDADPNARGSGGDTPLHMSMYDGT